MSWTISPTFRGQAVVSDADAQAYLRAVEVVDGQPLEAAVSSAVNSFVVGCKADGIWAAIKASCILAGARTLAGALVPLVGTAPANPSNVFVQADYDRKTGLVGNGTTKYLNTNYIFPASTQNNNHCAIWKNDTVSATNPYFIGGGIVSPSVNILTVGQNGIYNNSAQALSATNSSVGLHGTARSTSASTLFKRPGTATASASDTSLSVNGYGAYVFANNIAGTSAQHTASRFTFYSVGEFLSLDLLNARVTTLINALAVATP